MMLRVLASPMLPYTVVIDDISIFDIACTPLGNQVASAEGLELKEMSAFVKDGVVYLSAPLGRSIDVYDLSGRMVKQILLENKQAEIHDLKPGHYILKSDHITLKAQRVCVY